MPPSAVRPHACHGSKPRALPWDAVVAVVVAPSSSLLASYSLLLASRLCPVLAAAIATIAPAGALRFGGPIPRAPLRLRLASPWATNERPYGAMQSNRKGTLPSGLVWKWNSSKHGGSFVVETEGTRPPMVAASCSWLLASARSGVPWLAERSEATTRTHMRGERGCRWCHCCCRCS